MRLPARICYSPGISNMNVTLTFDKTEKQEILKAFSSGLPIVKELDLCTADGSVFYLEMEVPYIDDWNFYPRIFAEKDGSFVEKWIQLMASICATSKNLDIEIIQYSMDTSNWKIVSCGGFLDYLKAHFYSAGENLYLSDNPSDFLYYEIGEIFCLWASINY